jgi:hypothetical protein
VIFLVSNKETDNVMPMNGKGGFCSKSMSKLFPLLEAVRAGGDLSNLYQERKNNKCEFTCLNGVVRFRLSQQ